jgi:large subunit ribosomal protein L9
MKVILQKDLNKLGKTGDVVRVKDGYGRNYLIPRGIAIVADERNQRVLAHQKRISQSLAVKQLAVINELASKIQETTLSFKRESSEDGKLFGSVTNRDIAEALLEYDIDVDRRRINIPSPLKEIGRTEVEVVLSQEIKATVTVFIQTV